MDERNVNATWRGMCENNEDVIRVCMQVKELVDPCRQYGLVSYDEKFFKSKDFGYLAAAELKKESFAQLDIIPFEFTLRVLPAATYAVFTQKGVFNQIPVAYEYIYGTWFTQSKYNPIAPFDFELYEQDYEQTSSLHQSSLKHHW